MSEESIRQQDKQNSMSKTLKKILTQSKNRDNASVNKDAHMSSAFDPWATE